MIDNWEWLTEQHCTVCGSDDLRIIGRSELFECRRCGAVHDEYEDDDDAEGRQQHRRQYDDGF